MVFQSYAVWPHMTVRQNVAYPLKARGTPRGEQAKAIQEALELVELADYADRPVTQLSGGQMQRVALARSMVYHPQILLLDEPLSNLDAQLRLRLRDDLRRIIKQAGLTALYVTHDQTEAVVLGDRIGVMRDGKLLQLDTPREIYNRPADLFVARFTGATNVIEGRVTGRQEGFATIEARSGETLLARLGGGLAEGTSARVALRPDNVVFAPAGEGPNHFVAEVTSQHYQGTQTVYEITLLGTQIEALEVGSGARWEVGAKVPVALPPEMCWSYAA
jgi:iron(III) transport system ATP-binding protein